MNPPSPKLEWVLGTLQFCGILTVIICMVIAAGRLTWELCRLLLSGLCS